MEVTLLDGGNLPADPVLSVQVGPGQQRHACLEVNQTVTLPCTGLEHQEVEVGLYQRVASEVLPGGGKEALCSIPVRKSDGSATQVSLRVRRASPGCSLSDGQCVDGPVASTDQDCLYEWINGVVQAVLREQPEDPCRFLLGMLRKCRQQEAADGPNEGLAQLPTTGSADGGGGVEAAAPRGQARAAARHSLNLAFINAASAEDSARPLREKVQREAAQRLASFALGDSLERIAAGERAAPPSPGAIVHRPSMVARVQKEKYDLPRESLPTPVVCLAGHRNSWGQWLKE